MSLFVSPVVRATDANNAVLSGAKWFFYATGGTTPAAIYTTSALNVAHTNPVVADSAGLFASIYLDPTISYRAILKTSGGSVIQDIDPISQTFTGYTTGQGGTFTQPTSKSTTISFNKLAGQITMNNASLAAGATAVFAFGNTTIGNGDVVFVQIAGPLSPAIVNYEVRAAETQSGGCSIALKNISGGALAEAVKLNFVVIKGALS